MTIVDGARVVVVGLALAFCAASFAAPPKQGTTQTQYGCRRDSDCKYHGGVCDNGTCREGSVQPASSPTPQYEQPAASYEQPAANYEPLPGTNDTDTQSNDQSSVPNQPSTTDQVNDQLGKYNETLKCQNRCNADSLTCMGSCPNGNKGASCRGTCQLQANSCRVGCS